MLHQGGIPVPVLKNTYMYKLYLPKGAQYTGSYTYTCNTMVCLNWRVAELLTYNNCTYYRGKSLEQNRRAVLWLNIKGDLWFEKPHQMQNGFLRVALHHSTAL